MGFRTQKRRAQRNTWLMELGFWLMVPLVALSVHVLLALPLWALQWGLGVDLAPSGFFWANVGAALLLILGGWWLESSSLSQGGIALARRLGAREAQAENAAEKVYINVVQELCIAARMPPPAAIMVIERSPHINAMACGWQRRDTAIVLTGEALAQLTRDELQGVVAHELSHIREGDTWRNMQLTGMVYGLQMVYGYGRALFGIAAFFTRVVGAIIMYAGLAGWLAGCLLQAAISRQREYLADAHAVKWTRQNEGLIGALEKIHLHNRPGSAMDALDDLELMGNRLESRAMAHMWLAPSLEFQGRFSRWLDSHPPLEERVQRLQAPVQF